MKKIHSLIYLLFLTVSVQAQTYSISGTIKDASNGEKLIGVIAQVGELKAVGIETNDYGFYSLSLKEGDYTIIYRYTGYKTIEEKIALHGNIKKDISMQSNSNELNEVVVSSVAKNENIKSTQMGVDKLNMAQIKDIPVLFGERDVLKTLQLLPGVKSAGDGNSGFYVRGGAADQNLILLDEATVYNASHLLGFFSTFNSDAIKDVTLYKGNIPAQYGGRLSSVMDVRMNDGNDQHYGVTGGIGLISSRLQVEGPIEKDKGSFLISARRTYADVFLKLSPDTTINNNKLYFYDLNAKANYKLSSKDQLFLSGYFGQDKIAVGSLFGINWGNSTATLRWNHIYNSRLFSNTSLIYSNYKYNIGLQISNNDISIVSHIQDWNLKQEFQYYLDNKNTIKFGFNSVYHTILPGEINASSSSGINSLALSKKYSWENAIFANNDWKATTHLNISYGLRLSSFSVIGPGNFYDFDAAGNVLDTMSFKSGSFIKTYVNLEPRLSAAYVIDEANSIKAAYSRNTQNMHLLSSPTSSSPTDRWIPSSNVVKPEISDQVSIGYYKNLANNKYEFSIETYYKAMQNQVDYRDGADIQRLNELAEGELLFGKGRAYGAEFYIKKKTGKFTGWISYTLARTERQIDGINNDSWYPARQDQTHNLAVVAIYPVSKKWTLSSTFVYNTGNAVTFPSGKYVSGGQTYFYYTERNGYRMPAYHRLDIGATCKLRDRKKFSSELAFSLYNAYGHQNAYIINFQQDPNDPNKTQAVQYSLFRWVPSISYNFKFK